MITFVVEDGTGLANATSYVSVEEADDLAVLNIHNSDAWLALPLDQKRNLLMYVSRVLDSRTVWGGEQTTATQALAWPRKGVTDKYNNTVSSTAVPTAVRWAVIELAKHTQTEDVLSKATPDQIVTELRVDSISMKFASAETIAAKKFGIPDIVRDILKGLGSVRNSAAKITFGKASRT